MHESSAASNDFHVVGIGASAGGLEALERFFARVPSDCPMAFVVVQHLSPDFRSLMDELLARRTSLPIHLVEDGVRIEPAHVYLIPPKKEMIVSNGRLLLSEREPRQQELTMPIDVFFRSLAQDCGSRAIAIVLSGGGTDGSRGIRDVHDAGGLVLVQDEATAQFDGMPRTARDAGVAHRVLAPEDMPDVLMEHLREAGATTLLKPSEIAPPVGLGVVYQMLQEEFQIDFKDYKPSTVTRRIERRLALSRAEDIDEYIARLHRERSELDVLYRDLLIGVTRFFRDDDAFRLLEQRVLPDLLERTPPDMPLRVWVAGCATGEEAYSIAILLHELMERGTARTVKIFATDVHRGSLELAARGIYDDESLANVSPERRERYFVRHGGGFQVIPDVRQMLVFAGHNVIKDPPFTRVDLVSCRNLLIYLQPAAQQRVLTLFHFALNRGGVLVLGPSESHGALSHDFETIDGHWRVYRKHSDPRIPVVSRLQPTKPAEQRPLTGYHGGPARLLESYDALLDEFMPPSLLVSERGELLHAFAGASRFLARRDGRQSLDVRDMVDTELKMVLLGGLKRAMTDLAAVSFAGVRIIVGGQEQIHRVTIRPLGTRTGRPASLLVTFDAMEPRVPMDATPHDEIDIGTVSHEQMAALEAELDYTRESLQAAIEELEASNEELQAANEELLASNEELQSTNEELQSVNEELYTVNAEYQRKIDELTELTNDMDNLLSSTDVGTIFLDAQLRVRKLTPQIHETFNLLPQDIGRPIDAFTHTIDHPELMDDLRRVLETAERIEREIRDTRGRTFFLRILPYRAKGSVDGVVLTLIDVSGMKAAEDALFHERYLLDSLLGNVRDAIYFRDVRGRFIRCNQAMAERLGAASPAGLVGRTPFELCDHQTAIALHERDERVLCSGEPLHYAFDERVSPGGRQQWDVSTRLPMADREGRVVGVIGILRDVTDQKRAEQEIQDAVRRRDQFLAMLSHELRNPLGAIVMATAMLREGVSDADACGKMLETLERQSNQMARLLDDLLEASRVTQDKIELRKTVVDLGAVARDAADAVGSSMRARGVRFEIDIARDAMFVEGDPARLQQIQVNMLSNASKYTPRGGNVLLQVRPDGDFAVVRVRDDGVGITPEMLPRVFDLFVQSNNTLDRSDGGLGLGLTLVRSLVQMHGGTVSAHSDGEGRGSEFVVKLPLSHLDGAFPPRTARRPVLSRGARIVVVEDNEDSRELLCQFLTASGFECRAAHDGVLGLQLIEQFEPAIAIIDVGLPGIDGFEIARRLRTSGARDVYLVALTGYGQPSDRDRALAAGFDEHVVKPVHPETLHELLSSADAS